MALLRTTTPVGLDTREGRVSGPIKKLQWETVAEEQARNYEVLTNQDADGSGSPATVNAPHKHDGVAGRLFWQWGNMVFGNEQYIANRNPSVSGPGYGVVDFDGKTAQIATQATTTEQDNIVAWYFPTYISPAWVNKPVLILLHARGGAPRMLVTLEKPTAPSPAQLLPQPAVAGSDRIPMVGRGYGPEPGPLNEEDRLANENRRDADMWGVIIVPDSSGLHVIRCETSTYTSPVETREFLEMSILPAFLYNYPQEAPAIAPPQATNLVQVGDPENSNAWHPLDNVLARNDAPMGTIQMLATHNDALLQERAMGLPAAGQNNLTLTGHVHDGSSEGGAELDFVLGTWWWGFHRPMTGSTWYNAFSGNGFNAPAVSDGTPRRVLQTQVRTPVSVNNTVGTSKLKCALVAFEENASKNADICVDVTINGTTRSYCSGGLGQDSYLILSDPSLVFPFTSGGYSTVTVDIYDGNPPAPSSLTITLVGMCLYFEQ